MSIKLDFKPWKTMWTKPAETVRKIVNFNPRYGVLFFCFIAAAIYVLRRYLSIRLEKGASLPISLSIAFVIGFLAIPLVATLACWVGKKLGGKGKFIEVRAAVAWSGIVQIPPIILTLLGIESWSGLMLITGLLSFVLAAWFLWMLLLGYSEVEMFSKLRAFWALILTTVLTGIVFSLGFFVLMALVTSGAS